MAYSRLSYGIALNAVAFGARDRLGIKPLCWAVSGHALVVSSTLEPFSALRDFDRVDSVAVRDLLVFDYIPSPRSILQRVHKLEPGCRFQWRFGDELPTDRAILAPTQRRSLG